MSDQKVVQEVHDVRQCDSCFGYVAILPDERNPEAFVTCGRKCSVVEQLETTGFKVHQVEKAK